MAKPVTIRFIKSNAPPAHHDHGGRRPRRLPMVAARPGRRCAPLVDMVIDNVVAPFGQIPSLTTSICAYSVGPILC